MKTRFLFGMSVAIGLMLATSCSNDEQIVQSRDEAQVTFTLGLESGMDTRTISDGAGIDQLFYAIFNSEGSNVTSNTNQEVSDFPHNTAISLLKGEEYTAVFWAWNKECEAYTISEDSKSITIDYESAQNNDETRDAFFKSVTFTVTDNTTIDVVLKRPFAQLNVGVTEEEWKTAKGLGKEITKSKVEIKQAATTLNLIDGSVGGAEDIRFEAAAIPEENLIVDVDCDGEAEKYKYLSMCYFLANDTENGSSKTTLSDLKFTFLSDSDEEIFVLEEGLENAPVQRNHRTNIISSDGNKGGIITGDITVKVSLDPLYDGEHTLTDENIWEEYAGIYTEEALAGKTIEIPTNWHIRNGYILEPMPENWTAESTPLYTMPYTIDGNGNTVTFEPYEYNFVAKNAFAAADSKSVTIKNISFAGEHSGIFGGVYGGLKERNDYVTKFENVNIIDNGIYCYNENGNIPMSAFSNLGTATLDDCRIKGTYWVGEKDLNENAQSAYDNFGIYDIFVPNNKLTEIKNSTIGSIYVNNHGNLTISGISTIDKIDAKALVQGKVIVENGAKVTLLNVDEYSASYAPTINIKSGAEIETLQLNSIAKTNKITIEEGANISKIIWKNKEYTTITDFNTAIK